MDQMEKKQITNSSTVSRRSRTHSQDQGWEPPLRLKSFHAQPSPLSFPGKEIGV